MISTDEIFIQLNKNLELAYNEYGEENIFGIYAFGKINQGEGIQYISELTTEVIVFPSFEDVCLNKPMLEGNIDNVLFKDFRLIYAEARMGRGSSRITEGLFTEYKILNPRYELLYEKYLLKNQDAIHNAIVNDKGDGIYLLEKGITEILRQVFNQNSTSIKFIKELSDAEKKALSAILDEITEEGIVSINKLCAKVDISRQVFNNLLLKMHHDKVAITSNWGSRGTFIKIMDYRILDFNR